MRLISALRSAVTTEMIWLARLRSSVRLVSSTVIRFWSSISSLMLIWSNSWALMMSCETVKVPVSVLGTGTTLDTGAPAPAWFVVTFRVRSWWVNTLFAHPGGAELPPAHPPSDGRYCAKATIV